MPKVGDKEFAYTPEGITEAKAEAEATGEAMEIIDAASRTESYHIGGLVPGQPGFGERPSRGLFGMSGKDLRPDTGLTPDLSAPSIRPKTIGPAYKKGGKVNKK